MHNRRLLLIQYSDEILIRLRTARFRNISNTFRADYVSQRNVPIRVACQPNFHSANGFSNPSAANAFENPCSFAERCPSNNYIPVKKKVLFDRLLLASTKFCGPLRRGALRQPIIDTNLPLLPQSMSYYHRANKLRRSRSLYFP